MFTENPDIFLYTGEKIDVTFSDGLYRAKVGDRNYCATLFSGLIVCIGYFHSIYTSFDVECETITAVMKAIRKLRDSDKLEDRQDALGTLRMYPDDPDAAKIVGDIERKHVSFGAVYLARCLGKKNFSRVTVTEISTLVANILHRKELITELAEMVKLNA